MKEFLKDKIMLCWNSSMIGNMSTFPNDYRIHNTQTTLWILLTLNPNIDDTLSAVVKKVMSLL